MDDAESFSEIKQEYEEDLLEIVDNLKQEEPDEQAEENLCFSSNSTDSLNQHIKSEYNHENFVIVLENNAESTNIKQECKEEDPLNIADLKQEMKSTKNSEDICIPERDRYNCDKCERNFKYNKDLRRHIRNVHDNVRYNCDKCGKTFSQNSHLNRHIQSIHENLREFNCDDCEKSFNVKGHLTAHIKTMHEKCRYSCDKCDKSYSQKGHLKTHVEIVHDKKVLFNCEKCDKRFSRKADLDNHIIRAHDHAMKRVNVKTV